MRDVMPSPERALQRCLVCGSSEIHTDEAVDRGWLLLAECARCDRRWSAAAEPSAAPRLARCSPREVVSAA